MRPAFLAATLAALLVLAPAAQATPDVTRIAPAKAERKALKRAGIKLAVRAPASKRGARMKLPVRGGEVGASTARAQHAGAIVLRRKGRRAVLRAVRLTAFAGKGHLNAKLGGTQYTLARLRGVEDVPFNPITGEVRIDSAKVRLTGSVRRAIRSRLGARPPRRLGVLRTRATLDIAPPETAEPEPLERPASAVDVESAQIEWRPRETFICYVHAQGGPGVSVSGGAVAEAPVAYPPDHLSVPCSGAPQTPLSYTFGFPVLAQGWYDPESGRAAIGSTGAVHFDKDVFDLHVAAADPEVEITDGASRLVHTYSEDGESRRAVTADLAPGEPAVETGPEGDLEVTYTRIPGSVPDGPTASRLARFYLPGQAFGWVSVSFTVSAEDLP